MVNSDNDDQPIVKFVHKMIFDAVQMNASDIHFEPYEHIYRVRYRIDGKLLEISNPPIALKEKIAARIKNNAAVPAFSIFAPRPQIM